MFGAFGLLSVGLPGWFAQLIVEMSPSFIVMLGSLAISALISLRLPVLFLGEVFDLLDSH